MTLLVLSIATVLIVSGLCSLTEASLYAVRTPYVRQLAEQGSAAGRALAGFKHNMQQPIAAILILNTVANTAGAAIAGGQAEHLFGEAALFWFAAVFTLAVLLFAEIIPKVVGVAYNRTVARMMSLPLKGTVRALLPVIWVTDRITRVFQGAGRTPMAPEEEVQQLAVMSAEEGSILPEEADLVRNVLRLNDVSARDILTPRPVVFKLRSGQCVRDVAGEAGKIPYARIPLVAEDDPEHWTGFVLRRDILRALASDAFDVTLESMAKPLHVVPATIKGHHLLREFLTRRAHLFGVVGEYGDILGVVTLEDVLESLIGAEIVDETDATVDLRALALKRRAERFGNAVGGESSETDGR